MSDDKVLMPKALTAENGAKGLLMGEFYQTIHDDCPECYGDGCEECGGDGFHERKIMVSWTNIKAIYKLAVHGLGLEAALVVEASGLSPTWERLPDIPQGNEQVNNNECLETVVKWVLDLGLATGHADTLEQLLDEAGAQIKELMRNSTQDEQGD